MSRRKKKRGLPLGIALAVLVIGLVYAGVRGLLPEALTQVLQDSTASQEPSDSLEGFSGEAQVYYIDVGQGDSELIRLSQDSGESFDILIDAGTRSTKQELSDYLRQLGVENLDVVIGTHPHEDHIGGMAQVLEDFPVGVLYLPETSDDMTPTTKTYEDLLDAVEENQVTVKAGQAGQTLLEGDGVEMTVLSPSRTDYTDLNDYSIVTKLTVEETSFLFQGDAEAGVEEEILDSGADVACDVIKLGHHGSSTSSSRAYLEAASPSAAVISCGVGNDYGHPHEETLESLEDLGIPAYRTDTQKTLMAQTDGKQITWTTGLYSVVDAAS